MEFLGNASLRLFKNSKIISPEAYFSTAIFNANEMSSVSNVR